MNLDDYNSSIQSDIETLREFANRAKEDSYDPKQEVEISTAKDMAERCQKILSEELGELDGLAEEIRYYENETDLSREEISFEIADMFASGELGEDDWGQDMRVEAAVRVAVALLTEGVVAAPLEGISGVTLEENDDGTDYLRIGYNGPIRSAGGTGQALSVLVADHVRQSLGVDVFKPRDKEVERYREEVKIYDEEKGMQFVPSDEELELIIKNVPLMIDGMVTGDKDVIGYTDMERIDGSGSRGGVALVIAEGIGLKAPKIKRIVEDLEIDWSWLDGLSTVNTEEEEEDDDSEEDTDEADEETPEEKTERFNKPTGDLLDFENLEHPIFEPQKKYLKKLTGGRPIYASPSKRGGFRLRYGRARNTGLAAAGFSPATMYIMQNQMAPGMQHKTERPGKAAGTSPVDTLEGPTVRLNDGTVKTINDPDEAEEIVDDVEYIIDVGEILLNYGEFLENNHPLPPAPYNVEWWLQDLEHAGMPTDHLDPNQVDFSSAKNLSNKWDVPLHPEHTYLWRDIDAEQYHELATAVHNSDTQTIPDKNAETLENLLVQHTQNEDDTLTIPDDEYERLTYFLDHTVNPAEHDTGLQCVNAHTDIDVLPRVTLRVGSRMGRPEKAGLRKMEGNVHGLFPIGEHGGRLKDLNEAAQSTKDSDFTLKGESSDYSGKGIINVKLNHRACPSCGERMWNTKCEVCNQSTELISVCWNCAAQADADQHGEDCQQCGHGQYQQASKQEINLNYEYNRALKALNLHETQLPTTKLVEGLLSKSKTPEALEKPMIRAQNDVYPFRDSTVRYDMVDLPLTAFKPEEIQLSVEKAQQLGYTEDTNGNKFTDPDQTLEIFPQDIIISKEGAQYMKQTADYIDKLLTNYYNVDPWYNADEPEDLIGSLVLGLAPHTSATVTGRIIGITNTKTQYAHPMWHAAKRRNCFAPDTQLTYKLNGEWNQSSIEELVETHLQPESEGYDDTYADGSIVQHIDNHPNIEELKVPSMTDNGHRTVEPVEALSKHQPTDEMITIEFEDGTDLTVTPDHPVLTKGSDNTFTETQADNLEEGEEVYDYNSDQINTVKNFKTIDLLEELLQTDHNINLDNVMIRGIEKDQVYELLISEIKPKWDGRFYKMKSSCEYLDITKKTLDNYLRRESIPVSLFLKLYQDYENPEERVVENIPTGVSLGMNSDNVETPRTITLDEELATLIGYYTAEGYTRQTSDAREEDDTVGVNQVDFAGSEEQAREFFKDVLEKKFNIQDPFENETRVTASGNILRFFFTEVLDSGDGAYNKSVPELIKNSSRLVKGAYLSGYISGDGTISHNSLAMYTVSKELKSDLLQLFKELGFVSVNSSTAKPRLLRDKFSDFYDEDDDTLETEGYQVRLQQDDSYQFIEEFGIHITRKQNGQERNRNTKAVTNIKVSDKTEFTYDITVSNTHRFEAAQALRTNCDGDEDSIMLMLDGLLNFSRTFLPDSIGRTMDAPLVNTSVLEPTEIDDEAYNVDMVGQYSREFYLQTWETPGPKDVDVQIIEDVLDNPRGVKHTTEVGDINRGPYSSAYSEGGSMDEKVEKQLGLAAMTRAADEKMVGTKVIRKHFFPDLKGNLRAYAQQQVRCSKCNTKYRRPPLHGKCTECNDGGNLMFTVYEGMVNKYLPNVLDIKEDYGVDEYLEQEIEETRKEVESIFEMDTEEQTGLEDFL